MTRLELQFSSAEYHVSHVLSTRFTEFPYRPCLCILKYGDLMSVLTKPQCYITLIINYQ